MRVFLVILDGVGIGELPDAAEYGDQGSNTLLHVAQAAGGLRLPNLERLGLGRLLDLPGVPRVADPRAALGRLAERSKGKDSTTGHWELAGVVLERPFPTYPEGFPHDLLETWCARVGRGWLANAPYSGTAVIERYGAEHRRTGKYIVYTSADSVFQVAAHVDVVPLEELYESCRIAREMLQGPHGVGRVIARPFGGPDGALARISDKRRDFSLPPTAPTLLDRLSGAGHHVLTVGKVDDLFAGQGVSEGLHTRDNEDGQGILLDLAKRPGEGLVFANLVDFDQQFGHRNDPAGFARALESFDACAGALLGRLRSDEMVWITADHGNDPTTPSTDHAREYTPLLIAGPRVRAGAELGTRASFADVGATLAELFGVTLDTSGVSFLREVRA
jgi:phosphopentomutase